jgi:serine/threonine protein phosphatase PrpC
MQLSTDHSYVQELKNRGTFLDAATINRKSNIITRAVGVNKDLKFDYREVLLELGDKILLCSDGLYNELSHEEIAAILNYSEDIKLAAKQLLELCLSREAKDNISFILLEVQL